MAGGGFVPTVTLKLEEELLDSVWLEPELEEPLLVSPISEGDGVAIWVASLASLSAAAVASSSWPKVWPAATRIASDATAARQTRKFMIITKSRSQPGLVVGQTQPSGQHRNRASSAKRRRSHKDWLRHRRRDEGGSLNTEVI